MRRALAGVVSSLLLCSATVGRADPNNLVPLPTDNSVMVTQAIELVIASGGNVSQINQVGTNNYAETDQIGSSNYAGIGQYGNDNYAKVVQDATGAVAVYSQYGNGNQVTITQTGLHPAPVVVTQHR